MLDVHALTSWRVMEEDGHLVANYLTTLIGLQPLAINLKGFVFFTGPKNLNRTMRKYFLYHKRSRPPRFELTRKQPKSRIKKQHHLPRVELLRHQGLIMVPFSFGFIKDRIFISSFSPFV
ncbi:hypothetical protein QL285_090679 [Trifolium repens]|nr:hypothetical protein QL285_090679 [Trifolium repens]